MSGRTHRIARRASDMSGSMKSVGFHTATHLISQHFRITWASNPLCQLTLSHLTCQHQDILQTILHSYLPKIVCATCTLRPFHQTLRFSRQTKPASWNHECKRLPCHCVDISTEHLAARLAIGPTESRMIRYSPLHLSARLHSWEYFPNRRLLRL